MALVDSVRGVFVAHSWHITDSRIFSGFRGIIGEVFHVLTIDSDQTEDNGRA